MNNRYLVKNKYTYERAWELMDNTPGKWPYSHALGCVASPNYILPLWHTESGPSLYEGAMPTQSSPVSVEIDGAARACLGTATGFCVRVSDAAGDANGNAGNIRVTLYTREGGYVTSACGVGAASGEGGMTFSVKLPQSPIVSMQITTDREVAGGTLCVTPVNVWNTLGEFGGQAAFYETENATLCDTAEGLCLRVGTDAGQPSVLRPRELYLFKGTPYSMKMPLRNTVYMILRNPDGVKSATLRFTSDKHPEASDENAVTLPLTRDAGPRAYYFNLSLCPGCDGWLKSFELVFEGEGTVIIEGYSFEQEKSLEVPAVTVLSTLADKAGDSFCVRARFEDSASRLSDYIGGRIGLYAGTMADAAGLGPRRETTSGKKRVISLPLDSVSGEFSLPCVPLSEGTTTYLPYQFLLFAEKDGLPPVCMTDRFTVDNYDDFAENPYAFTLPDYELDVTGLGAYGDGIHNDTDAIQEAIDRVNAHGGGRVVIPGDTGLYGRRYIVTNLLLRDSVDLHLGDGAVLWQSQRTHDYPYEPSVGHDGVIPGINWTHSLHVSNLPLIQGANLSHIKITGHGSIRMLDTASVEGVDMPGYAAGCYRRIHAIPLGLFCCRYVETRDFEIIRSNNYHTEYNHCEFVYIANVRLHQVKCVSGDGYGMAGGKHILVNRCFLQSNDDGIVMSTHLYDPRGILWWTNMQGEDNCCRDITVLHSYINSGGGKALAFITWGTCDSNQSKEEICNIIAHDNVLTCVNPVGAWADNPYNGRQPFDNAETDDYSPVKNVRVTGNRYVGTCTLGPIQATNVLTDCGVVSTGNFRNGDFSLGGLANWTLWKNADPGSVDTVIYADKEKGRLCALECGQAAAGQGLHILTGHYTFSCELLTEGTDARLFVARIPAGDDLTQIGDIVAEATFNCRRPTVCELSFDLDASDTGDEADLYLGVSASGTADPAAFVLFDRCDLTGSVDTDGVNRRKIARYLEEVGRDFETGGDVGAVIENGKIYLSGRASEKPFVLSAKGTRGVMNISCAVRVEDYDTSRGQNGFGYRFGESGDGLCYRELRFWASRKQLVLREVRNGVETVLYTRDNFFFTSLDFHIFNLNVSKDAVSVWIDGAEYARIPAPLMSGRASVMMWDMRGSISGLSV